MIRHTCQERPHWKALAAEYGFHFHTIDGAPYWHEGGYYQFTLEQIENHIEDPTAELQQMCLEVVDLVVQDETLLSKFKIPEQFWQPIYDSWLKRQPSLYSRIDLAYDGVGPAKLYENNADTPTSVYETGFWQWLWLEDQVNAGHLHRNADQFNSLQEKLIERFRFIAATYQKSSLYVACCKDSAEDLGTVTYLADCAKQSGLTAPQVYIEDIGLNQENAFTDLDDQTIELLFKLYPWEMMLREAFNTHIQSSGTAFIEPLWKAILSNKALLPQLWKMFPNHPNLLPAYFADDAASADLSSYVRKPIFSREGANIQLIRNGRLLEEEIGPYGEEGYIVQAYHPLPRFGNRYTLIGSWLVGDEPAGISVREDVSLITKDTSQFLPHIIL